MYFIENNKFFTSLLIFDIIIHEMKSESLKTKIFEKFKKRKKKQIQCTKFFKKMK